VIKVTKSGHHRINFYPLKKEPGSYDGLMRVFDVSCILNPDIAIFGSKEDKNQKLLESRSVSRVLSKKVIQ